MSFSGTNIRLKVASGEPVPKTIIDFVISNGVLMLEHDNGRRLYRNGYLHLRVGRYSISIRTAFEQDQLDEVAGIAFAVNVRRRCRRRGSFARTVIAMVIDDEPSDEEKSDTPALPEEQDARSKCN